MIRAIDTRRIASAAAVLAATAGLAVAAPAAPARADTPSVFQLVNAASGKCLDVSGGSTADGAAVIQWARTGGTNQGWHYVAS
ncbi:RICIN domain-containing protein [Kitasatospora sp. NPDC086009]|uniref:RICIN domain-containing protein n=1 Tax=unclassified Kitasatospora TaxID=2633591 RepID=UPI0037C7BCF0